jgi:hypothetical protein
VGVSAPIAAAPPAPAAAPAPAPAVPPPAVAAPAETPVDQLLQDLLGGPEASSGSVGQSAGGAGSTAGAAGAAAPSAAADPVPGGGDLLGDDLLAGLTINEPAGAGQQQQPPPQSLAPSLLD